MKEVYYVEQTCGLASMIAWFVFGSVIIPALAVGWTWRILVYAVLSLTVVRMLPVAISLLGLRVDRATVLFVGWFGPRGLASIVFALIALEDLHGVEGPIDEVVGAIGLTVLLSVLAHGLSARPSPVGTPPPAIQTRTSHNIRAGRSAARQPAVGKA